MSYSRWIDSNWYSFWNSMCIDTIKEDQVLSLWYVGGDITDFTYSDLKGFTLETLKEIFPNVLEIELIEALEYIENFIQDVDKEFAEDDLK